MGHAEVFYLTEKQQGLLTVLLRADVDGWCDLDQVLERLPYKTTKQSLQFSIRALINHGLIEKKGRATRRGRRRVLLGPTQLGYAVMRSA